MAWSPAIRRYNARVLVLSIAYMALLFAAVYVFHHRPPHGLPAYLLAIAPALPIVGMFAAIGRYLVEESDEYLRQLMVRQSLWASGFALSIATVWGFLESFDLVGHVEAFYVAVLWFGGLGLGGIANALTARRRQA